MPNLHNYLYHIHAFKYLVFFIPLMNISESFFISDGQELQFHIVINNILVVGMANLVNLEAFMPWQDVFHILATELLFYVIYFRLADCYANHSVTFIFLLHYPNVHYATLQIHEPSYCFRYVGHDTWVFYRPRVTFEFLALVLTNLYLLAFEKNGFAANIFNFHHNSNFLNCFLHIVAGHFLKGHCFQL